MARHSPMLYYDVAADTLSRYRRFLWDFAYRATGTIADADTVLRECYPRTTQQPSVKHESDARQFLTSGAKRCVSESGDSMSVAGCLRRLKRGMPPLQGHGQTPPAVFATTS
jgi:hypothetical protein